MSSWVKGLVEVAIGIVAVAAGILLGPGGLFAASALAQLLGVTAIGAIATVGAGLAIAGAGTLINGSGQATGAAGVSIATQGGIQDWRYVYGPNVRVGGDLIYKHEWGDNDKFRDEVYAIACHPTQAVRRLLLNNQFVQIDPSDNTSFTPVQQTVNITTISRTNNVVTVVLNANIPYLDVGVEFNVQNVTGDHSLNGKYTVESIISQIAGSPGSVTFTYLCGGTTDTFSGQGQIKTAWPDYGRKIYMEVLNGNQTATFNGMLFGTGYDGDLTNIVNDGSNPWTADCVGYGHTLVMLRWHYNDTYFAGGMPTVAFIVDGKNDILDPRTGTRGFTWNAALCAADWASDNTECGLGYAYHTEIPDAPLIAAANICDETVALAGGGTTLRYVCSGQFTTAALPGTVFLNLLTACAGHYSEPGGQLIIWPGAWRGASPTAIDDLGQYSGPFDWSPAPSPRELYNGVKGTYYSPSNRWQLSDFPAYVQDLQHGYNIGVTSLAPYSGDANLAADQGQRLYLDIQLPFTPTSEMCQRIAKIELMRRRAFGVGTFRLNMTAFPITPMDVVSMINPVLGWTNKLLEVSAKRFAVTNQTDENTGAEAMAMGVEIDVVSTAANNYSWDPNEALTPEGYRSSNLPTNTFPDATAPPSQIQSFAITGSPSYDTQNVTLVGTGAFPVALNNFAGGKIWNVLGGDFDHPIFLADCPLQAGDTNWNWQITEPIPPSDQTWQLYAVSYGIDPVTGVVVSGPWLPVTSPTINETPHVTVAISANIPGNITSLSSVTLDSTDPLITKASGTATPPSPLHGFDACEVWYQDQTSGVTDKIHDYGVAKYDGSGTYSYILSFDKLAYAATYKVWFVPRNPQVTETLVTSGGGASPSIMFVVPARVSIVAPAPAVGTITPTVVFSSAGDGSNHWGITYDIAPGLSWVGVAYVDPVLIRTSSTPFSSDLGNNYNVPSGTTHMTGASDMNFARAAQGTTETWILQVTPYNSAGNPTGPTSSAAFNVVGGGTATPAPNVTSISNTITNLDNGQFMITSVFQMPAGYVNINWMDMRVRAYVGTSSTVALDSDIGRVDSFDFSVGNPQWNNSLLQFTFTHGPYDRDAAAQKWDVGARTYSGIGVVTATPTFSATTTVQPVGTTTGTSGIVATSVSLTQSTAIVKNADGIGQTQIIFAWRNPTSLDADSIQIELRDVTNGGPGVPILTEQISAYGTGVARSLTLPYPNVAITVQAIWWTLNADGVQISGTPPNAFLTLTVGGGTIDLTRVDPAKISAEFARNSGGVFSMASLSVGKLSAGNLAVALNVTVGGSINVSGTGGGSTYSILIDTANGFQVTNNTLNAQSRMFGSNLTIQGLSGFPASFTSILSYDQISFSNTSGITSQAVLSSGVSRNPSLNLTIGGGASASFGLDSTGAFLNMSSAASATLDMSGPNSLIKLNGPIQFMTAAGGSGSLIGGAYSGTFPVKDSSGVTRHIIFI